MTRSNCQSVGKSFETQIPIANNYTAVKTTKLSLSKTITQSLKQDLWGVHKKGDKPKQMSQIDCPFLSVSDKRFVDGNVNTIRQTPAFLATV